MGLKMISKSKMDDMIYKIFIYIYIKIIIMNFYQMNRSISFLIICIICFIFEYKN